MAKMMGSIFRKTDYCYFGCCTHVDLRNRKQKRMAHGIQRAREKSAVRNDLRGWTVSTRD